ncbi:MAG: UvrD-helicase domain-containing protein [Verrucomicrobiota bacterium]
MQSQVFVFIYPEGIKFCTMSREYVLQPFQASIALQIDYARELNEQQHAAVTAVPGPALVIAGAGSGKTRTLIYRVAFLLEQGIPPERILLLTFTNKAAKEMMRRVADLLGGDLTSLWGGTFHSVASRILRRHADRLGYRPDFTILDREDASDLLKASLDEAEIDVTATRFPKAEVLSNMFSLAANKELPIAEALERYYPTFAELVQQIEEIHRRFLSRKRIANVMDFDDLLLFLRQLLLEQKDIAEIYQRRFQFILVDEYQDTNKIQSDIIDLLAQRHRNVMVVGDDAQSIYSWRGAHFLNILEFPKRYPEAKTYKIETNYRSTPEILALANAAISLNRAQFTKQLTASRKSGTKPVRLVCTDSGQQAAFVAQRALQLRDEGISLNQMAVLYRSHFHALELQLELTRRNIPFSITSGIRFFEQAHIKDALAYLKLTTNRRDELSFKRIVQLLPGIGGKSADRLWHAYLGAMDQGGVLPGQSPAGLGAAFQMCASAVPKKATVQWAELSTTLAQLEMDPQRGKPALMLQLVLEAGYEDYLEETYENATSRIEDVQQLASFALQFNDTEAFLTDLSLASDIDAEDEAPGPDDAEKIRLSTIHQAKGLEFEVVFLIMLCDGLFPAARSLDRIEDEEEERRLFYVAITRARSELYLSYPLLRGRGYSTETMQQPSRFLGEFPPDLVEEWNLRGG